MTTSPIGPVSSVSVMQQIGSVDGVPAIALIAPSLRERADCDRTTLSQNVKSAISAPSNATTGALTATSRSRSQEHPSSQHRPQYYQHTRSNYRTVIPNIQLRHPTALTDQLRAVDEARSSANVKCATDAHQPRPHNKAFIFTGLRCPLPVDPDISIRAHGYRPISEVEWASRQSRMIA